MVLRLQLFGNAGHRRKEKSAKFSWIIFCQCVIKDFTMASLQSNLSFGIQDTFHRQTHFNIQPHVRINLHGPSVNFYRLFTSVCDGEIKYLELLNEFHLNRMRSYPSLPEMVKYHPIPTVIGMFVISCYFLLFRREVEKTWREWLGPSHHLPLVMVEHLSETHRPSLRKKKTILVSR